MKEADLVAGMRSSNITLVDAARVSARPAKPNVLLYGAASIAGGLLFGVCGALFRDATDTRIQELGEMELFFAEACIGLLPYHNTNRNGSAWVTRKRRRGHPRAPSIPPHPPSCGALGLLLCRHALSAGERRRSAFGEAQCVSASDGGPLHHDGDSKLPADHRVLAYAIHGHSSSRHLEIGQCLSDAGHLRTVIAAG